MQGPIFVVGTTRSGSTLLRLILDSHENLAIGPETYFMGAAAATIQIPGWRYGGDWYSRIGWSEAELYERIRDFYGGMFERYAAGQGKKRWGDKTPLHTGYMRQMAEIFPDSVFIGIVRHPAAVVSSLRQRFHYTFADAAEYWVSTNSEMVRRGAEIGDERFALVRYEDLVTRPEPTLHALLDHIGEPWSPSVLHHNEVQRDKGTPRYVDGQTNARQAIDAGRLDSWVGDFSGDEVAALDTVVNPLAGAVGYDLRSAELGECSATGEDGPLLRAGPLCGTLPDGEHGRTGERRFELLQQDKEELVDELMRVQDSLARTRGRRAVRIAEAVRRTQRARSVRELWQALRQTSDPVPTNVKQTPGRTT